MWSSRLKSLGRKSIRFLSCLLKAHDLEREIIFLEFAVLIVPDGDPDKPALLDTLAYNHVSRFNQDGKPQNIDSAIEALSHSSFLLPTREVFINLALALRLRFQSTKQLDDLKGTVLAFRRALDTTPDGHPGKLELHKSLVDTLRLRFECTNDMVDLKNAICALQLAIEAFQDMHSHKPMWLRHLADLLCHRFVCTGEPLDENAAILSLRAEINILPDHHADKPARLHYLYTALHRRYSSSRDLEDLEAAISTLSCAIELVPDTEERKISTLRELGNVLCIQFERSRRMHFLYQAISVYRCAVDITPDDHPSKSLAHFSLALSLQLYFEHKRDQSHFDSATASFMAAISQPLHPHTSALENLEMAVYCVTFLSDAFPRFSSQQSMSFAYSRIMKLIPETVWPGESVQERYITASIVGPVVNNAVSAAIKAGALPLAIEWLATGRSLVWSQTPISLHQDLSALRQRHPDLADSTDLMFHRLEQRGNRVHRHLMLNGILERDRTLFRPKPTRKASITHYQLRVQYYRLVSLIRRCAGFHDFLRPPKLMDLLLLAPRNTLSPVVFINVGEARCDALILLPSPIGKVVPVSLPNLSSQRAEDLRLRWSSYVTQGRGGRSLGHPDELSGPDNPLNHVLECIWMWIVQPILDALYLISYHDNGNHNLPHVTWCPTGPLTQLPLHAAGKYSDQSGPRVFNFVVSSYTSSLPALVRATRDLVDRRSTRLNVLLVTQHETPNHAPLPYVVPEGKRLQKMLHRSKIANTSLHHKNATVKSVRDVIGRHAWVHLACHGSQDRNDPSQSAFSLYDGSLTLNSLMQGISADNAELAFLSACQTATGDRHIPEESAHLAAGMLAIGFKGVVGTMWAIRDADAPVVVEAFYENLIQRRQAGFVGRGETGAAYALHEATRRLRESIGEGQFARWVPFVHFGV
ncbi:hypothetical protein PENSPDRAFT_576141 [Peniophora sp. CONT]|nr:hypothetical protein PENSPDRAFT_576141 [Peniophora sp. CONT]